MKFHRAVLYTGDRIGGYYCLLPGVRAKPTDRIKGVTFGRCAKCSEIIYLYKGKWKHLGIK